LPFPSLSCLETYYIPADWVETEFNEIKQTLAAEKSVTVPGWKIMFTVPQWRTRLFHGVAVQVFTQLSGISKSYLQTSMVLLIDANIARCDWILPSHHV